MDEKNTAEKDSLLKDGMTALYARHYKYFTSKYESLKNIDAFFLTMEGLGQFTMYAWLTNKDGGGLPVDVAIAGVRRGKKIWSQDEGFALFLLLAQNSEPRNWAREMFGNKSESVIDFLK